MLQLAIFAFSLNLASASTEAEWVVFKARYNKTYTGDDDVIRRFIWQSNLRTIEEHNELYAKGLKSYYLGENKYADLTLEEFSRSMKGYINLDVQEQPSPVVSGMYKGILPDSVDWRTKGAVTGVKDQGQCGSCWAFSTIGSVEGQHFKATGSLVSLSESNLVDCSTANMGCNGGWVEKALQYIINNRGIDTESSYPYRAQQSSCRFSSSNVGAKISSYTKVIRGSEDDLQKAVALVGPVSVAIDANQRSFQLYKGGVYNEPACTTSQLDHAVLVVGYGTSGNQDYWTVKNSWGTTWGQSGYIFMSRNKKNQCGIATAAMYPIV
ncbi:unnamed protein product [Lymnaea stagnalis]|uniref:Cathepsin L n=1 Tax=Lymnaea stagnalis TaxID=6523 RepID=A0AAV2I0J1_LYMST